MAGLGLVWLAGVRDLQWRARRFVFAVGGVALVFAVTLLLSGFRSAFDLEATRLVGDFQARTIVISDTAKGPFSSSRPIPDDAGAALVASGTAAHADPVLATRQPVLLPGDEPGDERYVYVVAHRLGGLGSPTLADGVAAVGEGDVVVDRSLGLELGEHLTFAGADLTVVGRTSGRTVFLGLPTVYLSIDVVQRLVLGDQPVATMVLVDAAVTDPGPGLRAVTADDARQDLIDPLKNAVVTVGLFRVLLWAVAAVILASVLYISVLERTRDLAVLKATGVRTVHLVSALVVQAVVLALVAAAVACGLAVAAMPVFPVNITLPGELMVQLAGVSVFVGLLGCCAGLRRAVGVEPSAAFS